MKGKNNKLFIIVMILVVISVSVSVGAVVLLNFQDSGESATTTNPIFNIGVDKSAQSGQLEGRSKEDIVEDLNKKVEENMINISMNMNPVFKDGLSEGDLLIYNEEINNHMQVVEIYIAESGELIYTSGGIPVGNRIDYAKLDKALDNGEYTCIAYFNAVDSETGALIGKAAAEIKITIQN